MRKPITLGLGGRAGRRLEDASSVAPVEAVDNRLHYLPIPAASSSIAVVTDFGRSIG